MDTRANFRSSSPRPFRTLYGFDVTNFDTDNVGDVTIIGIPYDVGTHPTRIGSRLGPTHIRDNSAPERQHLSDAPNKSGHKLHVTDLGDLDVLSGNYVDAFEKIEHAVDAVAGAGSIPLCLGGDGAVTLPQIRALAKVHPDLVTIHFDAHTDCYPVPPDAPFTNATTFSHAATEGLLNPGASFHVGVRGTSSVPNAPAHSDSLGYRIFTTDEWLANTVALVSEMSDTIGDRPVFLSFDMDIFDPSVAPGVCTPEWGGLSAAEGIAAIRALSAFNIVGADITTVSPAHDFQGNTGNLAARIALEILHILRPIQP